MSWKNDLDNAKKVFQNGTRKEKIDYIVEYYKFHFFIIVFFLYFIGSIIYKNITEKDYILQGIFLNTLVESEAATEMETEFIQEYPINTNSEDILFDSSLYYFANTDTPTSNYETFQVITARAASGNIDFIVANDSILLEFAYSEYLLELSEIFSNEQMNKYEPYFLYYDKAILKEIQTIDYAVDAISQIILPDPSKPELMEEPVAVMLNVTDSTKLSDLYPNSSQNLVLGFVSNGENTEKAIEFLDYLLQ